MILDEFVNVSISYRNITFYKNKGYDFKINNTYKIPTSDLNIYSQIKINVECDVCKATNLLSYQKYNKSLGNSNYYSCKKCSHNKKKNDFSKISKSISIVKKEKYDKITKQIEIECVLKCSECEDIFDLDNFRKNKNGRYCRVCKRCRSEKFKSYWDNLDVDIKRNRKRSYYRNSIHLNIWRSILKSCLFRKSMKKNEKTIHYLGYSSYDLKYHLQSNFDENMISLFKKDTPISVVNSLKNLRPLEKNKNFIKGDNLDEHSFLIIDEFKTYLKEEYIK